MENCRVQWAGEELHPQIEKVLWWPSTSTLLVADLHLGKIGHFRKAGIPLPVDSASHALRRLDEVVQRLRPERLLVLGDLTHSDWNPELNAFADWRKSVHSMELGLIRGNHDIIAERLLEEFAMKDLGMIHHEGGLELTHDPLENQPIREGFLRLSGHVHPGVRLAGRARQSMRLPCFWFGEHQGLLPAFGAFTGKARIQPAEGDRVVVIAGEQLLEMRIGEDREPAV